MSADEVAVAVAFSWAGAVLAISFIEAPLKFRAPGITIPLGLGIGRLVFGALNLLEVLLASVLVGSVVAGDLPSDSVRLAAILVGILSLQLLLRIPLDRRTRAVIAGQVRAGSSMHLIYIGLEVAKVVLLLTLGVNTLAAG